MFADVFELTLGDTKVRGRRLTVREVRKHLAALESGKLDLDASVKIVREHVRLANGGEFDPEELSPDQIKRLIAEIALPKEGRAVSDFIGLLC